MSLKEPCCSDSMVRLTGLYYFQFEGCYFKREHLQERKTQKSLAQCLNHSLPPCSTRYHLTVLGHWLKQTQPRASLPLTDTAPGWTGKQGAEMFTAVWLMALYKPNKKKIVNNDLKQASRFHVTNTSPEVDRNKNTATSEYAALIFHFLYQNIKIFPVNWENRHLGYRCSPLLCLRPANKLKSDTSPEVTGCNPLPKLNSMSPGCHREHKIYLKT